MIKQLVAAAALAGGIAAYGGTAFAAPPSPDNPAGHIGGIVPVHGSARTGSFGGSSNLSYHSGPVMNTSQVYLIYWVPPSTGSVSYAVSSAYESTVNQFFTDVATDSGQATNVYNVDTQYYGPSGSKIVYNEAFSASPTNVYYDSTLLPSSGCKDSATPVCLTDSQIQSEIKADIKAAGWTPTSTSLFFMLTGDNIGSCSGSSCAFTQYCAYHGVSGSGSTALYYANMPYAATNLSACGTQEYPNDPAADSEINVLSHEHNEAITDEALNAWYDRQGNEIGDKCAWNFGRILGGGGGAEYNEAIGGHHYYLQQEWSNKALACALQ